MASGARGSRRGNSAEQDGASRFFAAKIIEAAPFLPTRCSGTASQAFRPCQRRQVRRGDRDGDEVLPFFRHFLVSVSVRICSAPSASRASEPGAGRGEGSRELVETHRFRTSSPWVPSRTSPLSRFFRRLWHGGRTSSRPRHRSRGEQHDTGLFSAPSTPPSRALTNRRASQRFPGVPRDGPRRQQKRSQPTGPRHRADGGLNLPGRTRSARGQMGSASTTNQSPLFPRSSFRRRSEHHHQPGSKLFSRPGHASASEGRYRTTRGVPTVPVALWIRSRSADRSSSSRPATCTFPGRGRQQAASL